MAASPAMSPRSAAEAGQLKPSPERAHLKGGYAAFSDFDLKNAAFTAKIFQSNYSPRDPAQSHNMKKRVNVLGRDYSLNKLEIGWICLVSTGASLELGATTRRASDRLKPTRVARRAVSPAPALHLHLWSIHEHHGSQSTQRYPLRQGRSDDASCPNGLDRQLHRACTCRDARRPPESTRRTRAKRAVHRLLLI